MVLLKEESRRLRELFYAPPVVRFSAADVFASGDVTPDAAETSIDSTTASSSINSTTTTATSTSSTSASIVPSHSTSTTLTTLSSLDALLSALEQKTPAELLAGVKLHPFPAEDRDIFMTQSSAARALADVEGRDLSWSEVDHSIDLDRRFPDVTAYELELVLGDRDAA